MFSFPTRRLLPGSYSYPCFEKTNRNLIFFFFWNTNNFSQLHTLGVYGPLSAGHILIVQDFVRYPQRTECQMSGEEIQIPGQTFKIIANVDILWKREQPTLSLRLPGTETNPHGLNIHLNTSTFPQISLRYRGVTDG